jgi:hypothetical protein
MPAAEVEARALESVLLSRMRSRIRCRSNFAAARRIVKISSLTPLLITEPPVEQV